MLERLMRRITDAFWIGSDRFTHISNRISDKLNSPSCLIKLEFWFIIYLFLMQISIKYFPGNDSQNPLGYYGWYDQSQYLKILNDLICCGLEKKIEWPYPFGYAAISIPLYSIVKNSQLAITFTNILLLIISYLLIRGGLKIFTRSILLIAFVILTIKFEFLRIAFFVPWSTSATLTAFAFGFYVFSKPNHNLCWILSLALINGFLFFIRPQDGALLLLVSVFILFFRIRNISIGAIIAYVVLAIAPMLFSLLMTGSYLIGGGIYTSSQHSFIPLDILNKFISLFNGDEGYGIDSISIHEYNAFLYFGMLFVFFYAIMNLQIYFSVCLLCYLGLYLAFSDFGPHNLIVFQLFHYIKLPFLFCAIYFIQNIGEIKYIEYLKIFCIIVAFSFISIFYNSIDDNCALINNENAVIAECPGGRKGNLIYLKGYTKNFPAVYFDQSKLVINNERMVMFKDFRTYSAKDGLIVFLLRDIDIKNVEFEAINVTNRNNLKIYIYSRAGVI